MVAVKKGICWLQSATENYDAEFPDPSIADLARAWAMFAEVTGLLEAFLHDDAMNVNADNVHVEINQPNRR